MYKLHRMLLFVCLLSTVWGSVSISTAYGQAAPQATEETPLPVLTYFEDISQWRMASGFIYLTDTCTDSSAQTTANIRRRALYSSILSTLESIDGKPKCRTFRHAAADESGIYYYNRNLGRLEAIYSDAPNDAPTVLATIGDWLPIGFGDGISALRLDSSYVYWIEVLANGEFTPDDIRVKRVSKEGGTPKTLISYSTAKQASFEGLGVTRTHIWWTDGNGLNRISTCTVQLCAPGPLVKTIEFPLSSGEGHIQVSGSTVYWWNGDENPTRIRRTSCSPFGGNCSTSTLHVTSSNTLIAGLAANSDAAFWVEQVPLGGRRLRRIALSAGQAATLAENIHFAAPYLDVYGVYFQQDIRTISRLPFNAEALTREISVNGWEVTQGIQRPANDVPLVAGKETYVRLYPKLDDGTDVNAAAAELHGSRNNQPLPGSPIFPLNVTIPVVSGLSLADREQLDGGWLFRLPESWTRTGEGLIPQLDTTITLRAVIDPYGTYADSDNPTNNEITGDFLFTAKAPTCATLRPVSTAGAYQPVYGINMGQVVELSEAVLPTSKLITFPKNELLREIDWCWKGPVYGPFCSTPYELSDDDSGLLTKMGWLDFWEESHTLCYTNNARTLYGGIVHKDAIWDWGGLARRGKDQFLTKIPEYGDLISRLNGLAMTMVHEIGHNYNRRHIDCGDPLGPDPNYPYPTDMLDFNLSLDHPDLHFGFDPLYRTPINPLITKDYISYCGPEWYSDYTWKAIFKATRDPIFVPPPAVAAAAGELVRIAGLVDLSSNSGVLDYAWTLPAESVSAGQWAAWSADLLEAQTADTSATRVHVQLIGNGGQLLVDQNVALPEVEDGQPDGPAPFDLTLTAPAGPVTRIQLLADDSVLATVRPGPAVPSVKISQPGGGASFGDEITVSWTATDADDDRLLYTIQYSPNDGGEWHPLLTNYGGAGTASETVTLDISGEAGSGGPSARVRVLASDGYHTAMVVSQGFSVAKRAPLAAISVPVEGQVFGAGDVVPLHAFASDPEDGLIADDHFVWSSGQRGQATEVGGLAPGSQTLQLVVTDADGLEGTSSVSFEIAPLAVPEVIDSLVLDGRCDDPVYQGMPRLTLSPYSDGASATAQVVHTAGHLWLCLSGLQNVGGYAGLLLDADNSGDASVRSGDLGYFVQADGTRFVNEGDGGVFDSAPAGDLSARMVDHGATWSAELRIRKAAFGSWQKRVALTIGHFDQSGGGGTTWPRSATKTSPQSWGQANLGLVAALSALTPTSSVVGEGDIDLTVKGAAFDASHVVLWNGVAVVTTLIDATTLTAVVPTNLVPSAGSYQVAVGLKTVNGLTTAGTAFNVQNPQPSIAKLSPDTAEMGSNGRTVTINGAGFVDGATVIWNGEARAATFVSPTRLRFDLTADDLTGAINVPTVVLNPEPSQGPSTPALFSITSGLEDTYLPMTSR